MAPKRKKSKPNSNAPIEEQEAERVQSATTARPETSTPATIASASADAPSSSRQQGTEQPQPVDTKPRPVASAGRSSWYGSWRTSSKSFPVTQSTNESISVQQGTTSESSEAASNKRPAQALSKGMRSSRKSIPVVAEPTRVHATSDASDKSRVRLASEEKLQGIDGASGGMAEKSKDSVVMEDAPLPPDPISTPTKGGGGVSDSRSAGSTETLRPQQAGSWFGWWSRPDGYGGDTDRAYREANKAAAEAAEVAGSTPLPGTPTNDAADTPTENGMPGETTKSRGGGLETDGVLKATTREVNNLTHRSWFGLWSSVQNEQAKQEDNKQDNGDDRGPVKAPESTVTAEGEPETVEDAARHVATAQQGAQPSSNDSNSEAEQRRSSGWAFWSTDAKKGDPTPTPSGTQKQIGELAVADTPSQSHPEAAQFNEQRQKLDKPKRPDVKNASAFLKPKKGKQQDYLLSEAQSVVTTPSVSQIPSPAGPSTPVTEEPPKAPGREKLPQTKPNLVLPSFAEAYPTASNPGYMERMNNYILSTLRLQATSTPANHVYRDPQHPPRIKKAIAIGVHGFFPAPLIQRVLGQPTGTSIRFANYAASAIHTWCKDRQPEVKEVEVEKVALEGEGHIADRVTTLWKLLLNWLGHIRQADFILIACHSQGVPVAIMLLAKLIQLGCLGSNVKIGVCAMAGINTGPFPEYKSRLFGGAALELFEFGDSNSTVSKSYIDALEVCLRHGARISYIGSLDDQLVSLESSIFAPLSHPYVGRAIFIDGRLQSAPNFLSHLVVFALKLRNRGISDHGLIRELSSPLAGSLVGGDGHSRVYDDPAVYRLAIEFALESTNFTPVTASSNYASPASPHDRGKDTNEAAFARRSSLAGLPSSAAAANSIRRGSLNAAFAMSPGIAPTVVKYEMPLSSTNTNPFHLPWAVRGMLEEDLVKREMHDEVEELVREFEGWKPTSKVLKDVRWRLDGVRSML